MTNETATPLQRMPFSESLLNSLLDNPHALMMMMQYEDENYSHLESVVNHGEDFPSWPTKAYTAYYEHGRSIIAQDLEIWEPAVLKAFGFPAKEEPNYRAPAEAERDPIAALNHRLTRAHPEGVHIAEAYAHDVMAASLSDEMAASIAQELRRLANVERESQRVLLRMESLRTSLEEMEQRKDVAYEERNRVVAALAACFPSGIARTAIEGWSDDWHGCVYIDLPTGQASWHYHDSQAPLFAHLPEYKDEWDGHTTEEKYERVAKIAKQRPTYHQSLLDENVRANKMNKDLALLLLEEDRAGAIKWAKGIASTLGKEYMPVRVETDPQYMTIVVGGGGGGSADNLANVVHGGGNGGAGSRIAEPVQLHPPAASFNVRLAKLERQMVEVLRHIEIE